jgi:hypothetical protein
VNSAFMKEKSRKMILCESKSYVEVCVLIPYNLDLKRSGISQCYTAMI